MKTTRFLFIMIGCGVLLHGLSNAAPSSQDPGPQPTGIHERTIGDQTGDGGNDRTETKQADEEPDESRASVKATKGSPVGATKATSKQAPKNQKRSVEKPVENQKHSDEKQAINDTAKHASGAGVRHPVSNQPIGATKKNPGENKIAGNRTVPVRPPNITSLDGSKFNTVRSRAPGPGVLGGPAAFNPKRSTAILSGTGFHNRAY